MTLGGIALGDCWHHPKIRAGDASDGLIPFHKLSQWLSYSLIEPLESAGITVTHVDGLTGLPNIAMAGSSWTWGSSPCATPPLRMPPTRSTAPSSSNGAA